MKNVRRRNSYIYILRSCLPLLLVVTLGVTELSSAQSAPPDSRFGAVEAFRAPVEAAELGLGWERIIFFWSQLQPYSPDDWNVFHVEDGWLADAAAHGRQVVGLIEGTPKWATDGTLGAGVPRGLYLPIDDPSNLWATFVRALVRRYAGRIDHWIIWNEPDIAPGEYGMQWEGTVADFVQLTKVAYLVARQENPGAVIHFAGLTYWHDVVNKRPLYLQRYIDEARKDPDAAANNFYFDAVSLHIYFTTDSVYDITAQFAALLRRNGLSQPIWINETNAAPYDDPLNPWTIPDWTVTLDQQAGFVVQAFAQGLAAGAQRVAVYKLSDYPGYPPGYEPYGMIRSDGSLVRDYLYVVDGLRSMVRGGPWSGDAAPTGLILAGGDPIATDIVALGILKYFGRWEMVESKAVWEQTQIRRAIGLGLGARGPQEVELLAEDLTGGDREFARLLQAVRRHVG